MDYSNNCFKITLQEGTVTPKVMQPLGFKGYLQEEIINKVSCEQGAMNTWQNLVISLCSTLGLINISSI